MDLPLIQTKLFAPVPDPEVVLRHRLHESLSAADRSRVILVSAPAGSGKTTLISSWLEESGRTYTWLSLDEQDGDPHQLLAYIIASLRILRPDLGRSALALLKAMPPPPAETIAGGLINELIENGDTGVIVLDDYHSLQNPAAHSLVNFLVKRLPPDIALVVISRSDPPLALASLRARGQLCEIRDSDLRFGTEEALAFMERVCGCAMKKETIELLTARVEGWAAGLQLAGLAIRRSGDPDGFVTRFTGTHTYVADYLADEVLSGLSDEEQSFLIQTSMLKRLSGPLCDAVTGITDSHARLDDLCRANLFLIPLDDSRTWFRYHHLFADLLMRRCRERLGDRYEELLLRASQWCEQNDLWDEAVVYARDAGDVQRMAGLAATYGIPALSFGMVAKVLRWLADLPPGTVKESPDLCVIGAWSSNLLQDMYRLADYARRAEVLLAEGRRPHPGIAMIETHLALLSVGTDFIEGATPESVEGRLHDTRATIPEQGVLLRSIAEIMLAHSYTLRGMYAVASSMYEDARTSAMAAGSALMELLTSIGKAQVLYYSGDLDASRNVSRAALERVRKNVDDVMSGEVGILYALQALVNYEQNRLDEAKELCGRAMEILEAVGGAAGRSFSIVELVRTPPTILRSNAAGIFLTLYVLVRSLIHGRRFAEAESLLDVAEARMSDAARVIGQVVIDALKVRLWAAQKNHAALQIWKPVASNAAGRSVFWSCLSDLTRARAAFASGDHEAALSMLEHAVSESESTKTHSLLIEGLILRALACRSAARGLEAAVLTGRALELSAAHGFVRVWLDEGAGALGLLQQFITEKTSNGTLSAVAHARHLVEMLVTEQRKNTSEQADGLSDREVEVLRLMAAGLANRDIADRLFVAVGTVKKHTHTIYKKLDVENRTQAVRRAGELRLI